MSKLYQEMAKLIIARQNCIKTKNAEFEAIHEQNANNLLNFMPHGSGLNGDWHIDFNKSNGNKIILTQIYETMDDAGFYDRVIDFTLTIQPSLAFDVGLLITGNFGKYQGIKDYLYETLTEALTQELNQEAK